MAQSDGTAVLVHLLLLDLEDLHVGEGDDGEGLVDLVRVDGLLFHAGVLQRLRDGQGRSGGEPRRRLRRICPAEDLGDGLDVELLELFLAHQQQGGGTVGERGGVGGRDGTALLLEHRPKLGRLGLVEVLRLLVGIDDHVRLATSGSNLDRDNLVGKSLLLLRFKGLLVRSDTVAILVLARERVLAGTEFGLETHVLELVGVGQAILDDAVDDRLVTELGPVPDVGQVVGSVRHRLGTTGDDDGGVAGHDRLGAQDDGLEG